jgi:hypothetical protein
MSNALSSLLNSLGASTTGFSAAGTGTHRLGPAYGQDDGQKARANLRVASDGVDISDAARQRAARSPVIATAPSRLTAGAGNGSAGALDSLRLREQTQVEQVAFSFEVVTRDGDRVSVKLDLTDARSSSRFDARSDNGDSVHLQQFERTLERNVSIRVSGELDDAELAAIDKVSSQVVEIARDFLENGGNGAVEKAAQLDIDSTELGSFALSLAQRVTRSEQSIRFDGHQAARSLARLDPQFGADITGLGDALKELLTRDDADVDGGTKAQLAQRLLPHLLGAVAA